MSHSSYINKKMQPYKWFLLPIAIRRLKSAGTWYIDIPRTSSTSIKVEMGKTFGWPYGKKNVFEKQHSGQAFFRDHITATEMVELIGTSIWEEMFTFSLVRNPWDRMLSAYNYLKKRKLIPRNMTFLEYIRGVRHNSHDKAFEHKQLGRSMRNQIDFLVDDNNQIIVDQILHYESRVNDLAVVGKTINAPILGSLHLQVSTPHKDYRESYCDETAEFVSSYFKRDIEKFGYTF